eukprot:NODE_634_length_5185_cov_0.548565.p3 type:complete len:296 gc:universal NODE_634_length_5185_cov_0.548565:3300-4187(+)
MSLTTQEYAGFYSGFFAGLLSFIATTVVILVSLYVDPSANTRTNLVFCMMTAQWLRSFTVVSGSIIRLTNDFKDFDMGIGCSLNGFFIEQTLVAGDVANLCIGIFTWLAFAKKKQFAIIYDFMDNHYALTFAMPWIVASIYAGLAAAQPGYTPVKSNWCFISDADSNMWRWIYAWGHRILISIALFGFYGHILYLVVQSRKVLELSSSSSQDQSKKLNKAARKLFVYPIAYVIWGLPGILVRIFTDSPVLSILQMLSQSIGFIDAFLYGYSEDLRRRLVKKLRPQPQYAKDYRKY